MSVQDRLYKFIMGLNPESEQFRSHLLSKEIFQDVNGFA